MPASLWLASGFEQLFDRAIGLTVADRAANLPGVDVWILVSKMVSAIPFVVIPSVLSPRPLRVATGLVALWTLFGLLPVGYRIWTGYVLSEIGLALLSMAADVVGSLIGWAVVRWLVRTQRRASASATLMASLSSDGRPTGG